MRPIILGISGGTGAGKTFTVNNLLEAYPEGDNISINLDSYYKDLIHMDYRDRIKQNFDHPSSIDIDLIEDHLRQVTEGSDINVPTYDFSKHIRLKETRTISKSKIIILEGIFALHYAQLRKLYMIKIFIETPEIIRFERRLHRDVRERGRTLESVKKQYDSTVLPMHEKFIEPSKKYADLIINGNDDINMIINNIKERINLFVI